MVATEKIVVRRVLNATREEIFTAWTTPAQLCQWFRPGPSTRLPTVELDVKVGGALRIEMHTTDGSLLHTGHYREIMRPERISFTWQSAGTKGKETMVTIELHEHADGTELVLTHTALPDIVSANSHHDGWTAIVSHLAEHLALRDFKGSR